MKTLLRKQQELRPTYLYIKQHSLTGKLYFGKTYRDDVESYNGSGTEWMKHIKENGKEHIETLWYCLFNNKKELTKFALLFSEQQKIVESDNWLNEVPESGLGGGSLRGRISPNKGKPSGRKGIKTGRSPTNKGQKLSEETLIQRKKTIELKYAAGYISPNKGRTQSDEEKKRRSDAMLGVNTGNILPTRGTPKEKLTCPWCNKEGAGPSMHRFHFGYCNKSPNPKIKPPSKNLGQTYKPRKEVICPHCDKIGTNQGNMNRYHFNNCKAKK